MNNILQSVHLQYLAPSASLEQPQSEVWVIANGFYSLPAKEGRKAIFRSKQLCPELTGPNRAMTVSKMVDSGGNEYLSSGVQTLGPRGTAPDWTAMGFLTLQRDEQAFEATGILAGGSLQEDSPLYGMGYRTQQLYVSPEGLLELRVF